MHHVMMQEVEIRCMAKLVAVDNMEEMEELQVREEKMALIQ